MTEPVRRVYLHIGMPKSGTTYLQEKLWHNRTTLRDAGLCYPGDVKQAHFLAMLDLTGLAFGGQRNPDAEGAWTRLVERARRGTGSVVISSELFVHAMPEDVDRAMADLSWAEVHLVCTVRDLARQVPAMWQETTKNHMPFSYTEFSSRVRNAEPSDWAFYWRLGGPPVVLGVWARGLPPERVHLVTVPPAGAGPDVLWTRFADTVGIDPATPLVEPKFTNPSLGAAEANLMRRLNFATADVGWPTYRRLVKALLGMDVLAGRPDARKPRLPAEDQAWVSQRSAEMLRELRQAGYQVTGDLDEILPRFDATGPADHPDQVDEAEVLDAAVDALIALARRVRQESADGRIRDTDAVAALVQANAALLRRVDRASGRRPSVTHQLLGTLRYLSEHNARVNWLHGKYRDAKAKLLGQPVRN